MPIISRGGGGGAPASSWTVEYEAEFAEPGTTDFLAVPATTFVKAVNGVNWTAYGNGTNNLVDFADDFETGPTGLVISPGAGRNYWGTDIHTAKFGALVSDLVAAGGTPWNYLRDNIAVQLYATADALSSNHQMYGLSVDVQTTGAWGEWCAARTVWVGAVNASAIRWSSLVETPVPVAQPDFFELVLGPRLGSASISVGNWQGSFPEPLDVPADAGWSGLKQSAVVKNAEGADPTNVGAFNSTNARFEIFGSRPSGAGVFTLKAHKIRVLRRP